MRGTLLPLLILAVALVGCSDESPRPQPVTFGDGFAGQPDDGAPSRTPAPVDVPADAPLVVFLGDSISAGLHLASSEAFPAVIQRTLAEQGLPFRLVNAGVSGDTSKGGTSRLDWLLKQEPDVLVLELGGNDALRGIPLEHVDANLREIVTRTREAGVSVLLLGVVIFNNYGDYAQRFAALYPALAEELAVPFVPYFMEAVADVPELNLPDGLHPNAEGHRRIAARVAPALAELLATAPEEDDAP